MSTPQKIVSVTIFAIAMAFLETSVVIYMRELYYPEGFAFPLKLLQPYILNTEIFRELATLFMLAALGIIAGKNNIERFAYFIFSFAVWDIFYYVFLKLVLNWPGSMITWDILFLIPTTWVGPVLAPVINSVMMIWLAMIILFKPLVKISITSWSILISGSLLVLYSYTEEYSFFILRQFSLGDLLTGTNSSEVMTYACTFVPHYFNWYIFGAGAIAHFVAILLIKKGKNGLRS